MAKRKTAEQRVLAKKVLSWVKGELKRRNMTHRDLYALIYDVSDPEKQKVLELTNLLNRGNPSVGWLGLVLTKLEVKTIRVNEMFGLE